MGLMITAATFGMLRLKLSQQFKKNAHTVHPKMWQGVNVEKRPEMRSHELLNVDIGIDLMGREDLQYYRDDINPNLPWADDHFEERVCGEPINPGVEWANWPWGKSASGFLEDGKFNHNYMERYWPRFAGVVKAPTKTAADYAAAMIDVPMSMMPKGINGNVYGDLKDIVEMLVDDPFTRQAWLPIYFPEDTGAPGRKPCTLGYQFIMRDNQLHVYYPLRSCDYIRHFQDDCYLTIRLLLWVLDECRTIDKNWNDVKPGSYSMHCTSLHIFANDWNLLK